MSEEEKNEIKRRIPNWKNLLKEGINIPNVNERNEIENQNEMEKIVFRLNYISKIEEKYISETQKTINELIQYNQQKDETIKQQQNQINEMNLTIQQKDEMINEYQEFMNQLQHFVKSWKTEMKEQMEISEENEEDENNQFGNHFYLDELNHIKTTEQQFIKDLKEEKEMYQEQFLHPNDQFKKENKNIDKRKDDIIFQLRQREQIRMINELIKNKYKYILKYEIKAIGGEITEHFTITKKLMTEAERKRRNYELVLPIVQIRKSDEELQSFKIIVNTKEYNKDRNELFIKNSGSDMKYEIIDDEKNEIKYIKHKDDKLIASISNPKYVAAPFTK